MKNKLNINTYKPFIPTKTAITLIKCPNIGRLSLPLIFHCTLVHKSEVKIESINCLAIWSLELMLLNRIIW